MKNRTYLVGLTGGIACGKSAVAELFLAKNGVGLVDADQVSRDIVQPGRRRLKRLAEAFGKDLIRSDGTLDRQALAQIVYSDSALLAKLNRIMHPEILQECQQQIFECSKQNDVVVVMAPLLYEVGADALVDTTWVVYVEPEVQLRRLMSRDSLTREQALARVTAQIPLEEKLRRADVCLDNNGDLADLARAFEVCWQEKLVPHLG